MKNLKLYIIVCFWCIFTIGCSKDEIDTYDEQFPSVMFPSMGVQQSKYPGYSSVTKKFERVYSFWSNPDTDKVVIEIPMVIIGDVRSYDRKVNYEVDIDSCSLLEGSYRILDAVIPAGSAYGNISIEVAKLPALDSTTCVLELVLAGSADFAQGPKDRIRMKFSWDNQLSMPPSNSSFYPRTYNYLINAGQAMTRANYDYYSKNAHKAILEALNWPWEAEKWPQYNGRDPLGVSFITAVQANAYYDLLNAYLEAYEQEHGEPLLHDGGLAEGQPVVARKF